MLVFTEVSYSNNLTKQRHIYKFTIFFFILAVSEREQLHVCECARAHYNIIMTKLSRPQFTFISGCHKILLHQFSWIVENVFLAER